MAIMTSNFQGPVTECRRGGHPALACSISGFVYHHNFVERRQHQILYAKKPRTDQARRRHTPLEELTELIQTEQERIGIGSSSIQYVLIGLTFPDFTNRRPEGLHSTIL
jgi:hypothetical protein